MSSATITPELDDVNTKNPYAVIGCVGEKTTFTLIKEMIERICMVHDMFDKTRQKRYIIARYTFFYILKNFENQPNNVVYNSYGINRVTHFHGINTITDIIESPQRSAQKELILRCIGEYISTFDRINKHEPHNDN